MTECVQLVTAATLVGMPEFMEAELGSLALSRAYAAAGLRPDIPIQEGYFIPEVSVARFLGSAMHQSGDPLLGAKLGVHLNIGAQGAWGRYVLEAETLGACLERFEQALVCFCTYPLTRLDVTNDLAWLRFQFATSGHEDYRQIALATVGSATNIFRHYTAPGWFPERVELNIPPPSTPSAVEEFFPADIRYNADYIGLAFPREFLTLRRRPELPIGHTTFSEALRARSHKPNETFEAAVEEIIRLQIETGSVSLDAAARSLDLGVRTVQRELERTGLHFRDLTSRVRLGLAHERVVETGMPLAAVAEAAGYTNPFNFSRAYRKHFGTAPSEIRKLAKGTARTSRPELGD